MTVAPPISPHVKDLFMRIAKGDEAAFTELFYQYTQRIYHYIFSKTKSRLTSEEIVQEVFIKLWINREKLTEVINPESYLFGMAANRLFDWFKKMAYDQKMKEHVWQTVSDFSNITFETLDLHSSQELINNAIETLTPQQKKIYLLNRQEGLTRKEIAEQLNLSEKTVNNHLYEAIHLIREYIQRTPGATMASLIVILGLYH